MFTKLTPKTDSSLSNKEIANLAAAEAIAQVKLLTGLSEQACINLLSEQFGSSTTSPTTKAFKTPSAPILEHSESLYIAQLFS